MSASTTYDVRLRYMLDNQAGNGLRGIEGGARAAAQSTGLLASNIARLGGAVAGAFGLNQARKALVDYNSSMEQAKITAAGLLQLNIGGSWTDNMSRATEVVSRLQQEAKTSVGTTADMVQMFSMLAQPLSQAGAGMDDFVNLTKASVVASRAMGIAADVAARDVDQAIRGQFHSVDQFSSKILGPLGYIGEAGRAKFNALTQQDRLGTVRKALNQPAIAQMAQAQGDSFAGVLSTFEDNLQIAFGKVGLPLFKQITAEVQRWNQWIDTNGAAIAAFGRNLGDSLVTAFGYLKGVAGFFVEHKDTLLTIAKVWAGLKLTGMAGGAIGGVVGGFNGLGASFGGLAGTLDGPTGMIGGFAKLAANSLTAATNLASVAAASVALGALIGQKAGEWYTDRQVAQRSAEIVGPNALRNYQSLASGRLSAYDLARFSPELAKEKEKRQDLLLKTLKTSGLASTSGVNTETFAAMLGQDRGLRSQYAQALDVHTMLRTAAGQSYAGSLSDDPEQLAAAVAKAFDPIIKEAVDRATKPVPPIDTKKQDAKAPKVNVTIQRIEVASDDPDRFLFNLEQAVAKVARNPGQARRLLR